MVACLQSLCQAQCYTARTKVAVPFPKPGPDVKLLGQQDPCRDKLCSCMDAVGTAMLCVITCAPAVTLAFCTWFVVVPGETLSLQRRTVCRLMLGRR